MKFSFYIKDRNSTTRYVTYMIYANVCLEILSCLSFMIMVLFFKGENVT
jgi:hypothetical protein